MLVQVYSPRYAEGINKRIVIQKTTKAKTGRSVAQVVEQLSSKYKALSSNPTAPKNYHISQAWQLIFVNPSTKETEAGGSGVQSQLGYEARPCVK
jgi:hypothetical protein